MSDTKSNDILLLGSIAGLLLSGALNFHLWLELNRHKTLAQTQKIQIEAMEKTLLLNR